MIRNCLTSVFALLFLNSVIFSHLSYGLATWSQATQSVIKSIVVSLQSGLENLGQKGNNVPSLSMRKYRILSFAHCIDFHYVKLVFKCLNVLAPLCISLFQEITEFWQSTCLPKLILYSQLKEGQQATAGLKKRFKKNIKSSLKKFHITSCNWEHIVLNRHSCKKSMQEGAARHEMELSHAAETEQRHHKETEKKAQPSPTTTTLPCPHCTTVCGLRIGLYSRPKTHNTSPLRWVGNLIFFIGSDKGLFKVFSTLIHIYKKENFKKKNKLAVLWRNDVFMQLINRPVTFKLQLSAWALISFLPIFGTSL